MNKVRTKMLLLTGCALLTGLAASSYGENVSVADFSDQVKDGDWSPAIQAAIDFIHTENGYVRGGQLYFPPGDYRIDSTLVVGRNAEHWGLHLIGYGARLIGSETLDQQPTREHFRERLRTVKGNLPLTALADERDLGNAILELHNPPGFEGAGYVVEGLTFDREAGRRGGGIGLKIPAEEVPKGTTLRSIKVFRQAIGIYMNHVYQIYITDCIIRGNGIGMLGQNHFNNVSIIHSIFRRNHYHGLQIGPNRRTWGSSGIYIAGNIFESNKGYGILNAGGVQVTITGCYFESEGNSIGVLNPMGNTTIDTNHFWGSYGHGWRITPYANLAHVVIGSAINVQLRNNRYAGVPNPVLIVDPLQTDERFGGKNHRFDTVPIVMDGVRLPDGFRAGSDDGLSFYEYDAAENVFKKQRLVQ